MEALRSLAQMPAAHHRLLIRELEAVERGDTRKLMVFMPPGSAKSTYASVLFAAWFLARQPNRSVIGASNTSTLAEQFSKRVQNLVREFGQVLGYSLLTESAEIWRTSTNGQYRAAGVGGVVTGFRADLAIIDDPLKGREDADSETMREKAWNWFQADLMTRLKPGGRVVLVQTRWHEDDLAGRLLQVDRDGWRVISLPAQAEENDPLGREPGEWLWGDDDYGYGHMLQEAKKNYEVSGAMRDWGALYQQSPRPVDGALFKIANIEVLKVAPNLRGAVIGSGWDFAATKKAGTRDPDWTSRVKIARLQTGQYVVLDVFRGRGGPDEVDAWLLNISTQDRMDTPGVKISIPQDPAAAGKSKALSNARLLAGFHMEITPESGDKTTRAYPVISQCNARNLAIVEGDWNRAFLDELAGFPNGSKDDQVDALSRAFSVVGLGPAALNISDDVLKALGQR